MLDPKLQAVHKDKALGAIRRKEAWAKEFLLRARDESKKYIMAAHSRAEEIKKRGAAEIEAEIKRLREEKARKVSLEFARIEKDAEMEIEQIRQKARERLQATADFIINAILEELDAHS